MSGMTEPPYAYARAFLMAAASAVAKRAFSIGAMTSSHTESIIDSWARTEYAEAGRVKSSAPSRKRAATLQRRVLERRVRVSRMRSRTLGKMLCKHDAARGFRLRVAGEAEKATTVLERHDDLADGAVHLSDLAPADAEIERAAEFEPAAGQDEVTVLVGPPAAKPDGRCVVALVPWRQRVGCLDRRHVAAPKAVGELSRLEVDSRVVRKM